MNARLLLLLARGPLAANRLRAALTLAAVALGVALAGAVHTIHTSALAEIDHAARTLAGSADVQVRGPRNGFDDALFAAIASRPEVAAASPVLEIDATTSRGERLRIVGIDALRASRLQPAFLSDTARTGAAEVGTLLESDSLWLAPAAAARLAAKPGDDVPVATPSGPVKLHVAGILPGLAGGGDVAAMDIAGAQWRFGRIGSLSRIDLRLRSGVDAASFKRMLAATLPAGLVVETPATASQRAADISRAYRVNLDALSLVALATGAFLVFSTLALQAARRRQEFALLRALGVTRRGVAALLVMDGAALGVAGGALGTGLGMLLSRELLARLGADLGAGFFSTATPAFAPDPVALGAIAALGLAMSIAGSLWVASAVGRIDVAEALRDRAIDLPGSQASAWPALLLAAAGVPLLFLPSIAELPVAGYAAIALWLAASVAAVAPACRWLLARAAPRRSPIAALAVAQVRDLPGHLAASVAGIVVSVALCVAMAIMIFSFRVSVESWLGGVVRADLYVDAGAPGGDAIFTKEAQQRAAALEGVARVEALRFDRLALSAGGAPFTLVARPVDESVLAGFDAEPRSLPPPGGETPVWISEAARDLQGWHVGSRIEIPLAGRRVPVRIVGMIRDFARTWGAMIMPLDRYRALTGDTGANELGIFVVPGADREAVQRRLREALDRSGAIQLEDAASLKRLSLEIFDRSFAVTYALEAIAILIGLTGVTSSFAALAWSRRREFGVLRFLGLTRGQVLELLALEGAAAGAVGAVIGLACGAAVSGVLVKVVNRQSFHWSLDIHWPVATLAALVAAIVALCALGARVSGAYAVRGEAVLAVKDDA
ncbi:MAG TPA: FtsX-like permease family protein [Usitatibacter sp.]|nr:FtsX-like permease family protein [Usitatibacter sp.]